MSPHAVSSFVQDLVEMAKATEELPHLKGRVNELTDASRRDGETIARLETRVMELKAREDELLAKLRSVEVERDEATFRQMEADDKVSQLVRTLRSSQVTLGQAIAVATGSAKDITVMMSAAEEDEWEDYKLREELKAEAEARKAEEDRLAAEAAKSIPVVVQEIVEVPQGQSGSNPTMPTGPECTVSSTVEGQSVSPPTPAQEPQTGTGTENAALGSEPAQGKYAGKHYHDWPYYVSESAWIAGGGTKEDYYWYPPANVAQS